MEGNGNSEGRGDPKGGNFQGGGGGSKLLESFFFPGLQVRLMSKLSVISLLISDSNKKLLYS